MMNENVFREAPLSLINSFSVGDGIMLTTFPVGDPAICYRLAARIVADEGGLIEGTIMKVGTLGDDLPAHPYYKLGDSVKFKSANIMGSASDVSAKK